MKKLEVFHSSEYDLLDYFDEEPAEGWYYWKTGPGIHVLDLEPKGPFSTQEKARAAGQRGRALPRAARAASCGPKGAVRMPEAWQIHQMNRYYDERFMGRIYQFRREQPPHLTCLVAEMRLDTELYACQEFNEHAWFQAAQYLDRMYKNTDTPLREEASA